MIFALGRMMVRPEVRVILVTFAKTNVGVDQWIKHLHPLGRFHVHRLGDELVTTGVVCAHGKRSVFRHNHKRTCVNALTNQVIRIHKVMNEEGHFVETAARLHELESALPNFLEEILQRSQEPHRSLESQHDEGLGDHE